MASKSYWRERELKHIKANIKNDKKIAKRLRSKYRDAMEEIQSQIDEFYGKYAKKTGLGMEEARKRISKTNISKYERKAKKYVKERNFTPRANEEMRLYNVTMKINRLELLKQEVNLELIALSSDEERILYEELTKAAKAEYKHQSGILRTTIEGNAKTIKSIVDSSFLNARWSDRIWANQQALHSDLDKLLHRGPIPGLNPRELARDLRDRFDASVYNSERLLRTEMARVQTDVFEDSMKKADIDKYEWVAEPDACEECADLDGKIFDLKDRRTGDTGVPKHPNCRCALAAYVDRGEWEKEMQARGL